MKKLMMLLTLALVGMTAVGCENIEKSKTPEKFEKPQNLEKIEYEILIAGAYRHKLTEINEHEVHLVRSADQIPDFIELEQDDPMLSVDFTQNSLVCTVGRFPHSFNSIDVGFFVNTDNSKEYVLDATLTYGPIVLDSPSSWLVVVKTPLLPENPKIELDIHSKSVKL